MERSKLALSTWGLKEKPSNFTQTQINLWKTCGKAATCNLVECSIHFYRRLMTIFLGLIILKLTPLTDRQSSPSILDLLDHFVKFLLFVFSQKFVIFNAGNVQLVLCFWLWGLKWAGQDGEFDIFQDLFRRINEINLSNGSYFDWNLWFDKKNWESKLKF